MQYQINLNLNRAFTAFNIKSVRFISSDRQSKQIFTKSKTIKLPNIDSTVQLLPIEQVHQIKNQQLDIQIENSQITDTCVFSPINFNFEFKVDSQKFLELRSKLQNDMTQHQFIIQKINTINNKLDNIFLIIEQQRDKLESLWMQLNSK